jgi:curved DNA-binding protein CbpA
VESPHDILGVRRDATEEEVKKAFREGVKRTHPDRVDGGDEKELKRLIEAYRVLSTQTQTRTFRREPPPKRAAPQREEPRGPVTVFHTGPSVFATANAQYRTVASLPFLIFQ